jgi:hypothetical protein
LLIDIDIIPHSIPHNSIDVTIHSQSTATFVYDLTFSVWLQLSVPLKEEQIHYTFVNKTSNKTVEVDFLLGEESICLKPTELLEQCQEYDVIYCV